MNTETPTNEPTIEEAIAAAAAPTNGSRPADGGARLTATRSIEEMVEQARARAVQYVLGISEATHTTLGQRIDELDNLRERIRQTENALQHYVGEFARSNAEARILAEHMKKDIEEASVPFSKNPPATLTQKES